MYSVHIQMVGIQILTIINKEYSGDLNTHHLNQNHLNTKLFEVQISNGLVLKWSVYGL